jgi:hypothetical protein
MPQVKSLETLNKSFSSNVLPCKVFSFLSTPVQDVDITASQGNLHTLALFGKRSEILFLDFTARYDLTVPVTPYTPSLLGLET